MKKGKLYLIPSTLGGENLDMTVVPFLKAIINDIDHYIVENERHARRYLRSLEIGKPIVELTLHLLDKRSKPKEINHYLNATNNGQNIGLISEAGCPGVADPGALIVAMAHEKGIQVVPITGPSSILLALMASGFNGQQFTFNGYLPRERPQRIRRFKELEALANKTGNTQIFMDTPYRNNHVMEDLLIHCHPNTKLCIAADITMESEFIKTKSIKDWKKKKIDLHKRPLMFLIGR